MAQENSTVEKNKVDKVMEYILNTPENTNPAILKGMLEDLSSEGGGGGESDFSTATVTIINTVADSVIRADSAFITDNNMVLSARAYYGTTELTIVLYKGSAELEVDADEITSTSGDLEELDPFVYKVTGNCTITGSGPSGD